MWIQNSYKNEDEASLYVVPTPIGNLDDMTFRAVDTLKSVTMIAAEDTRQTRKLLNHFNIHTRLISYHEHSEQAREQQLIDQLKAGNSIAIVSDAGMPAISDPGLRLIQAVINERINVIVLPGANAALCALVGSGLRTDEFLFYGFLPRQKNKKIEEVNRLNRLTATIILYESPYRVKDTLNLLYKQLGNRRISNSREITKRYEEIVRGQLKSVIQWIEHETLKGEFCLVIEGNEEEEDEESSLWWSHLSIKEHVKHYEKTEHIRTNAAIKRVARDREMKRQEVYQIVHIDS